ncbi:LuxR family transcriptional regulator [Ktedonosporobacter rubrisoli]|uniref:LuxR family transcriptional regulator n=1 Tax=Ktedonosporobacter rubrisoli TaxID=2509675 RepID=A0A4P6JKP1_KTERU|nr:LuxR C-terminal-related transcriptional regulator [Ktedonosporobacter rubrisoli]QBD75748.1 LuxR family transcriptional regulator [Ktedonosporobacter rubrisoli]
MARQALYTLIWSQQQRCYELQTHGQPTLSLRSAEDLAFSSFLQTHTSFAFVGQAGRLSVRKESRTARVSYWYAYRKRAGQTYKRYLGATSQLTFARLEQVANELNDSSSPAIIATRGEQKPAPSMPLLASRCTPPRLPPSLVQRTRLLNDLQAVINQPLTLVSAPAGSGKTTLLSAWVAALSRPQQGGYQLKGTDVAVAWLSLEELDNDPARFGTSYIAALQIACAHIKGLPTPGRKTMAVLHGQEMLPLSSILTPLLADIEQVGREVIFILDDYHVLSDQVIAESMRFLLEHAPTNLHMVLATRSDPELPLSRLRMRGQLLEIRNQDLRFTRAEAASYLLEGMGLPFSEEEVTALQARSEGWIAGLQLAALSARKRENLSSFVQDFTGSHRFVLDFVQQDVLAHLPGPLQDFMLQTSILTRMNARLCQAVTATLGLAECQEMLVALERANLFIMPLDDQRQWYRYHDLFREALLAQLHTRYPTLVPLLHLRAAHFYEAAGEAREAITHALAAPDYTYAANLMEQAAEHLWWLSGEIRAVHTWVLALPDAVLRAHVGLALNATLHMLNSIYLSNKRLYAMVQNQLERAFTNIEGLLGKKAELSLSDAEVALIQRRLFLLRALFEMRGLLRCGDVERVLQLVEAADALPADPEAHWNLVPLQLAFCLTVILKREGASLIPRLLAARQHMMEAGNPQATIRVKCWLAQAYSQDARWHQAYQEALSALTLLEQSGPHTSIAGYLYACLFNACYAWKQLEEAATWLLKLRQSAQDCQVVDLLVTGEVLGARLALASRDLSSAQLALDRLAALVEQEGFAHHAALLDHLVRQVEEQRRDGCSALRRPNVDQPSTLLEPLTTREQRVLRLLVAGQTYAEIAKTLIVSPNTIKTQVSSIYRKLNVGRRAEAIARAEQLHLLANWEAESS